MRAIQPPERPSRRGQHRADLLGPENDHLTTFDSCGWSHSQRQPGKPNCPGTHKKSPKSFRQCLASKPDDLPAPNPGALINCQIVAQADVNVVQHQWDHDGLEIAPFDRFLVLCCRPGGITVSLGPFRLRQTIILREVFGARQRQRGRNEAGNGRWPLGWRPFFSSPLGWVRPRCADSSALMFRFWAGFV